MRRTTVRHACTVGALGTALAACAGLGLAELSSARAGTDDGARQRTVVRLSFDEGLIGTEVAGAVPNAGDQDVVVEPLTARGGEIVYRKRTRLGPAVRLPTFDDGADGARAVLVASDIDLTDGDQLSPGLSRFSFGADFRLAGVSVGEAHDNGNNLVQRGLAGSSDQLKLQVDHADDGFHASCVIATNDAQGSRSAYVASRAVIEPGRWYRARCTRVTGELRIVVTAYAADGTLGRSVTDRRTGVPAIDLTWPRTAPVVPLSVGGKVVPGGVIAAQSDQFNGLVDDVVLTVG